MGFNSPLFFLGLASTDPTAGYVSLIGFWIGGGGEGPSGVVVDSIYIPTWRRRRR